MTLQWYLLKWSDLKLVWESGSKRDLDTYDTYALLGSRWVTISLRVDHLSASSRPRSRCVLRRPFNQKLQRPNVSTWCKLHNKKVLLIGQYCSILQFRQLISVSFHLPPKIVSEASWPFTRHIQCRPPQPAPPIWLNSCSSAKPEKLTRTDTKNPQAWNVHINWIIW